MKQNVLKILIFFFAFQISAQSQKVSVKKDSDGMRLMVDGKPLMINGMNWDYIPIGTNYSYNFWNKPDDFIKQASTATQTQII